MISAYIFTFKFMVSQKSLTKKTGKTATSCVLWTGKRR